MKRIIIYLTLALIICVFSSCVGDEHRLTDGVTYYPTKTDSQIIGIVENSVIITTTESESNDISTIVMSDEMTVYITPKGEKYHYSETCPGKNSTPITLKEALEGGREACTRCVK